MICYSTEECSRQRMQSMTRLHLGLLPEIKKRLITWIVRKNGVSLSYENLSVVDVLVLDECPV